MSELPEHITYSASGPSAAFFDLDRTLISGSSVFVFGIAAWRAGLIRRSEFAHDALGALAFRLRGAGDDTSNAVRERILGAVSGVHHEDLVALNSQIVPKLLERVRPEARRLVDLHRHAGRGNVHRLRLTGGARRAAGTRGSG